MTSAEALKTVEAIAAYGLSESGDQTGDTKIEIDDAIADEVLAGIAENRISGTAILALTQDAIASSEETEEKLIAQHDEVMGQSMRTEIMAVRVSDMLTGAGIEHRLLKGAALAHTVYEDPAARSFRDVDVLVSSAAIEATVALLTSHGATRAQPELRPGYDKRFAKSVTLKLDGVEVDLHRVLSPGPFGVWMKPNDLFVLRSVIDVAGVNIPILDRTDNLLHACYHLALGQVEPVLSNVRDAALLAGTDANIGFDATRFDQSVDRWKGRVVVRRAVRIVERRLGVTLPEPLRSYGRAVADQAELAALEPYLASGDGGRFGALVPATLKALPMADRAAYALAVGLPEGTEPVERLKGLLKRT